MKDFLRVGDILIPINNIRMARNTISIDKKYIVTGLEPTLFKIVDDSGLEHYFNYGCLDEGSSYYAFRCIRIERLLKIRALCL